MRGCIDNLEQYRQKHPIFGVMGEGVNGFFRIPSPHSKLSKRILLTVQSSDGQGWDHVSISAPNRNPSWTEMCFIKDLFFEHWETVVQYHPKSEEYVNNHKTCLHLWRKQEHEYELPNSLLVGIK